MDEKTDRNPPVLEYQPQSERAAQSFGMWVRWLNSGDDSFLACTALLLACIAWAIRVLTWLAGGQDEFACAGLASAAISVLLALGGLVEPRTSKTFPLVSLAMDGIYGIGIVIR